MEGKSDTSRKTYTWQHTLYEEDKKIRKKERKGKDTYEGNNNHEEKKKKVIEEIVKYFSTIPEGTYPPYQVRPPSAYKKTTKIREKSPERIYNARPPHKIDDLKTWLNPLTGHKLPIAE